MSKEKVIEEEQKTGKDILLFFVGILLIIYGIYCVMEAVAYGSGNWGYFLFYLFMAFVFVFIGKGIMAKGRILMIAGFFFFIMYVLFVVVGLIFYGYRIGIIPIIFITVNLAAALILFIRLEWYRKFVK